jgi:hypothetical protein
MRFELVRTASRTRILGIPVYALTDQDDSFVPLYFAKVRYALACLALYDARRFKRMAQDVERILVSYCMGSHFDPQLRMIVLLWSEIARQPPERVALTLVHESTHARHRTCGIDYAPNLRARIEEACVAPEVAFAKRLPNGTDHLERYATILDTPWWTDEMIVKRKLRSMQYAGSPGWLIRLANWHLQRQVRRSRDHESVATFAKKRRLKNDGRRPGSGGAAGNAS